VLSKNQFSKKSTLDAIIYDQNTGIITRRSETVSIKAIFTCSMYFDVVSNELGKCSISGITQLNLASKEKGKYETMKLLLVLHLWNGIESILKVKSNYNKIKM